MHSCYTTKIVYLPPGTNLTTTAQECTGHLTPSVVLSITQISLRDKRHEFEFEFEIAEIPEKDWCISLVQGPVSLQILDLINPDLLGVCRR